LLWDATNDRLGIGVSPSQILHLYGTSIRPQIESTGNGGYTSLRFVGKNSAGTARTFEIGLNITADDVWQITNGSSSFVSVSTSGNVLVGTTTDQGQRLLVQGTGGTTGFTRFTDGVTAAMFIGVNSGTPFIHSNNSTLSFGASGSNTFSPTMTLSGGNVGIGVTPNSWGGTNVKALEVYLASISASLTWGSAFTFNTFYDGSNWKYIGPYTGGKYEIGGDEHIFSNAPNGSAGATATFTTRLKITSGGNVLIGTTTDAGYKLDVAGTGRFSGKSFASGFTSRTGTISIASGVTSTITNMDVNGVFLVNIQVNGGSLIFNATNYFMANNTNGQYVNAGSLYDGANVTLSNSGSAIQITNGGFSTLLWHWSVFIMPYDAI
jgi:hypothetical protein